MLPDRAVQLINEYSKPITRPDWRKSKSVFIKPNDEECIDELSIHVHVVIILIVLFNIVIYINVLFILGIIIGICVSIYKSI
jgi:hypothetical protein